MKNTAAKKSGVDTNSITSGPSAVITTKHPDYKFLKPGQAIVIDMDSPIWKGLQGYSSGGGATGGNVDDPAKEDPTKKLPTDPTPVAVDTPSLSDIESIEYIKYYDANKILKIKAIIKIKNSSVNKAKVSGVDARITDLGGS